MGRLETPGGLETKQELATLLRKMMKMFVKEKAEAETSPQAMRRRDDIDDAPCGHLTQLNTQSFSFVRMSAAFLQQARR